MEKTKLMLEFFEETRCIFNPDIERGMVTESYIAWLEAKATAYDRLMSGGHKTLKEWANFLGKPVTVDKSGAIYAHEFVPHCAFGDMWVSNLFDCMQISPNLIDYIGDWKDSLTLPDGWEETK